MEKCQAIDSGRAVERRPVRRYAGTIAAIAAGTLAVFILGPAYLRHALSALLIVSRSVEAATPYRIEVTPGNATVPRGVDQAITAQTGWLRRGAGGADGAQVARRAVRADDAAALESAADRHQYEGMLFDLAGPIDYFIEAAGVRSATYTLKVVDLPYVQKLQLEYHFPAYTGLEPRKVEDGGDIAVLKGTEVRVHVVPTMTSPGGQILLHDKETAALAPGADGLDGKFVADKDGFYRIELDAPTGERVTASPQYTIDVLADQPPTVSISKPGRDTSASPIEEVFVEARAEDDYGVKDLDLVYSVNGGAEKTLRLFDGKNRLTEVTAGHTFYLEELDVRRVISCPTTRVPPTTTPWPAPSGRRATSTSCRSVPCARSSSAPSRTPAAAAGAAVATSRSARSRSSSARSSPRRSTSTAIARRWRPTSCARTRP